jgi:hypothetical protein
MERTRTINRKCYYEMNRKFAKIDDKQLFLQLNYR